MGPLLLGLDRPGGGGVVEQRRVPFQLEDYTQVDLAG